MLDQVRILVIDDDPSVRTFVQAVAETRGICVEECADGFSAIERLRTGRYDLVLLDLLMPRANGFEVLREIKALRPTLMPDVIVMTGACPATIASHPPLQDARQQNRWSGHHDAGHRRPQTTEGMKNRTARRRLRMNSTATPAVTTEVQPGELTDLLEEARRMLDTGRHRLDVLQQNVDRANLLQEQTLLAFREFVKGTSTFVKEVSRIADTD